MGREELRMLGRVPGNPIASDLDCIGGSQPPKYALRTAGLWSSSAPVPVRRLGKRFRTSSIRLRVPKPSRRAHVASWT
jgi:hypothetical protein